MSPPVRVLMVVPTLATGGLERIVLELCRGGPAAGFACAVAALGEPGDLAPLAAAAGAPVFSLGKRPGLDFALVPRLYRLIRQRDIQVVHAHNEGAGLYAGLAARLARRPLVVTRHGLSPGHANRGLRTTVGLLARQTICVAEAVRRLAREVDRIPAGRLLVIYHGVDPAEFAPDPARRAAVRDGLGIKPGEPVLAAVGRLAPEKDQATLLAALAALPGVRLLLAGDGPSREGLEQRARALGVAERVAFLGTRREVAGLLSAADVFVLSSLSEGVSKAILEAMAAGLPVVATRVGGNPELVEEGRSGRLVPPGEPALLAAALGELLADPALAARLGRRGRERVVAEFRFEQTLAAHAGLYRRLAAGKAAAR